MRSHLLSSTFPIEKQESIKLVLFAVGGILESSAYTFFSAFFSNEGEVGVVCGIFDTVCSQHAMEMVLACWVCRVISWIVTFGPSICFVVSYDVF